MIDRNRRVFSHWVRYFVATLLGMGAAAMASGQPLDSVTSQACVYGDCENGSGRLELKKVCFYVFPISYLYCNYIRYNTSPQDTKYS